MQEFGEFNFNAQVERVHCRPWGLSGGHPGAGNQVSVRCEEGEIRFPTGKVHGRVLKAGDAYILRSGGGGGYGSPLERPVASIEADLIEGYISRDRAEKCYGVVFDERGRVDEAATQARRAELRSFGGLVAQRDSEDRANEETPKGLYLAEARLFPLRCC